MFLHLPLAAKALRGEILDKGATDDIQASLQAVLPTSAFFETWLAYFDFLDVRAAGGRPSDEILLQAAMQVGADPHSTELWMRILSYAASSSSSNPDGGVSELYRDLLHTAVQMPLHNSRRILELYLETHKPAAAGGDVGDDRAAATAAVVLRHKRAVQLLRREPPWGNRFTEVELPGSRRSDETPPVHRAVQRLLSEWNAALRHMFTDLQQGALGLDAGVQLQRIDLAFRQAVAQLPFVESCWIEYARFLASCMEDWDAASKIVGDAVSRCGGEEQLSSAGQAFVIDLKKKIDRAKKGSLTEEKKTGVRTNNSLSFSGSTAQLVHQRVLITQLHGAESGGGVSSLESDAAARIHPESRKRFRDLGKQAEAAKVSTAPVYLQWAAAENVVLQDTAMTAKVLERAAVRTADSSLDDFLSVCRAAVEFHSGRAHETEVQQFCEKALGAASAASNNGILHGVWQSLIRTEADMHGAVAAEAAQQRQHRQLRLPQSQLESFVLRHSAGGVLAPASTEELRLLQFLSDVEKGTMDDADYLPTAFSKTSRAAVQRPVALQTLSGSRSLTGPAATSGGPPGQWVSFRTPPNPVPLCSLPADEVCGPRHLRGQLVGRLEMSKSLMLKVLREKRHRQRCAAAATASFSQASGNSLLPRSLTHLVSQLDVPLYHAQHLAACRLIDASWLLATLAAKDLALGAGKPPPPQQNRGAR
jgi:hypothetical protein